jgi:hypothetical protein
MSDKAPEVVHVEPKLDKREVAQLQKDKVQMTDEHFAKRVEGKTTLIYKPEGVLLAALICRPPGHLEIQEAAQSTYRNVARNLPIRTTALGVRNIHNIKPNGTLDSYLRPDRTDPRYVYAKKYARDGVMHAMDSTRNKAEYARISEFDVNDIPAALTHAKFLGDIRPNMLRSTSNVSSKQFSK